MSRGISSFPSIDGRRALGNDIVCSQTRSNCYEDANRVRSRPEALGRAEKRRCSNSASDPFLPIWLTLKPTSSIILAITITSTYTSAPTLIHAIILINRRLNTMF